LFQSTIAAPPVSPTVRCCVSRCVAPATHTPILRISLSGSEHFSRVSLPAQVCARHREAFAEQFLTASRRAGIEETLRSRGRNAPDWSRTTVEFS
jgi:hypothetical protein